MLFLFYKNMTTKAGFNSKKVDLGHDSPCSPSNGDTETSSEHEQQRQSRLGWARIWSFPRKPSYPHQGGISKRNMILGNFLPVMLLL